MLSADTPPLRLLVIAQPAAARDVLSAQVREAGHRPRAVADGAAALAAVEGEAPDLVLLDLSMPGNDGFALLRRLRERFEPDWVPVIAVSPRASDGQVIEALAGGADDHVAWPVNPALLRAKLDHYARVLSLQARLKALARHQADIHDNISDPVITLDGDGRIVEANRAACESLGLQRPLPPEGVPAQAVIGVGLEALLAGQPVPLTRPDGQTYQAEVSVSRWREGACARVTAVLRDLTERQRTERMRDEFLATVSHELRTPLTSVLGAVALLAAGAAGPLPPAALPLAEAAQRNGTRLSRLIDDILDLTKLEGDRLPLFLRPQPLLPLLQEALAANQGYAERCGVTLHLRPDAGAAGDEEARVDAERFLQVMANLLSNAIKHSPRGEPVEVGLAKLGAVLKVTVADRGPGVPPAFRTQLFEKFAQAEGGDRRAQGGTGLGLYITRLLVERMGGRLRLEPDPGLGATFGVDLPTASAWGAAEAPGLLHIELDPDHRQRVAGWLVELGTVRSLGSLAGLGARPAGIDVVLANPQGQGQVDRFCAALRQVAGGLPVLLLSDSVAGDFAAAQGFGWLSLAHSDATQLRAAVRERLPFKPPPGGRP